MKITRFEDIEAWKEARVLVSMVYSLRSTAEVQSQLYAALDLHYLDDGTFNSLMEKSTRVAKLLQGFIRYLKTTTKPSTKKQLMVDSSMVKGVKEEGT